MNGAVILGCDDTRTVRTKLPLFPLSKLLYELLGTVVTNLSFK